MRRAGPWVLGAVVALVVMLTHPPGAAGQGADNVSFAVRARADSAAAQLIGKDVPLAGIAGGEVVFLSPASAQTELDSVGASRAFAMSPTTGDFIFGVPVLAAAALPVPPPAPPGIASSSYPATPESRQGAGPYGVSATSSERASSADAHIGLSTTSPLVAHASATSSVRRDDGGKVIADAAADVAPLDVNGVLHIGRVHSTAHLELNAADPSRPPTATSSTSVGAMTVAGVPVTLDEQGLHTAAGAVPIGSLPVAGQLAAAGVDVEYVKGSKTSSGVVSDAVQVTYRTTLPATGETTVRLLLGQVSALGSVASGPVAPGPDSDADIAPLAPVATPSVTPEPSRPSSRPPTAASPPLITASSLDDLARFYPPLVLGAAVGLVTSRVRRRRSVGAPTRRSARRRGGPT